jgi:osmotically-inducible protein OsmY
MSSLSAANGLKILKLSAAIAFAAGASGCASTVLAVGASAAAVAISDKTAGAALDDSATGAEIKAKMFQSKGYSLGDVQVAVAEGFVLLTGTAPTPQDRIEAERRAWTAAGARNVANEIKVGSSRSIPSAMRDGAISAEVRGKYFHSTVKAMNYTIETNERTVYLLGIARTREELTDAVEEARTVKGVEKVVSYVRILDRPVIEQPETAAQAAAIRAEQLGLKGGPQPQQTLPYGPDNPPPAQPDYAQYEPPAPASYNQPAYAQQRAPYQYGAPSQPAADFGGSPVSSDSLGAASDTFAGETRPSVPDVAPYAPPSAPSADPARGSGPVVLTPP